MRAKLVSIVAILWVAAVGATTVAFIANRTDHDTLGSYVCDRYENIGDSTVKRCVESHMVGSREWRSFEWGGWLAWAGAITLVAAVAIAIILVSTRKASRN